MGKRPKRPPVGRRIPQARFAAGGTSMWRPPPHHSAPVPSSWTKILKPRTASHVLGGEHFRYLREIVDGDQACLEFASELDGIHINGVDIIRWNGEGKIQDFKVMVRPLKAINKVWEKMAEMLAAQAG